MTLKIAFQQMHSTCFALHMDCYNLSLLKSDKSQYYLDYERKP